MAKEHILNELDKKSALGMRYEAEEEFVKAQELYTFIETTLASLLERYPDMPDLVDRLKHISSRKKSLHELQNRLKGGEKISRYETLLSVEKAQVFRVFIRPDQPPHRELICSGTFQLLEPIQSNELNQVTEVSSSSSSSSSSHDSSTPSSSPPSMSSSSESDASSSKTLTSLIMIRVAHWQYPLSSSIPCLILKKGYYVFPSATKNMFYGLILPAATPSIYFQSFEDVLCRYCSVKYSTHHTSSDDTFPTTSDSCSEVSSSSPPPSTSPSFFKMDMKSPEVVVPPSSASTEVAVVSKNNSVEASSTTVTTPSGTAITSSNSLRAKALNMTSKGLDNFGFIAVKGILATGKLLRSGIAKGGDYILSRSNQCQQPAKIPEAVKSTTSKMAEVTPHVVWVSATLVDAMVQFASATGTILGEEIKHTSLGAKYLEKSREPDGPAMAAMKTAGLSALTAAVNIWDALDAVGDTLVKDVGHQTGRVVGHKYGEEAKEVASNVYTSVTSSYTAVRNIETMATKKGLKKLGKKMAKASAKNAAVTYFMYDNDNGEGQHLHLKGPEIDGKAKAKLLLEGGSNTTTTTSSSSVSSASAKGPLTITCEGERDTRPNEDGDVVDDDDNDAFESPDESFDEEEEELQKEKK